MRKPAMLFFALFLIATIPSGAASLNGTVKEFMTERPLPGAIVLLVGYGISDTTDSLGRFWMQMPSAVRAPLSSRRPERGIVRYSPQSGLTPSFPHGNREIYKVYDPQGRRIADISQDVKTGRLPGGIYICTHDTKKANPSLLPVLNAVGWQSFMITGSPIHGAAKSTSIAIDDTIRITCNGFHAGSFYIPKQLDSITCLLYSSDAVEGVKSGAWKGGTSDGEVFSVMISASGKEIENAFFSSLPRIQPNQGFIGPYYISDSGLARIGDSIFFYFTDTVLMGRSSINRQTWVNFIPPICQTQGNTQTCEYGRLVTQSYGTVFKGEFNTPPRPILLLPYDHAAFQSEAPTFRWTSVPQATSYILQVAADREFSKIALEKSPLPDTAYTIATALDFAKTYFWRVKALIGGIADIWSSPSIFITKLDPATPVLEAPSNGLKNVPIPTFLSWSTIKDAQSYRLQLSALPDFSSLIKDSTVNSSSLLLDGIEFGASYYWRVCSKLPNRTSEWSVSAAFQAQQDTALKRVGVARWSWFSTSGSPGIDAGRAIGADQQGNCYIAGDFSDTLKFGATALISKGESDFFLAKADSTGRLIWVKAAGNQGVDNAKGLAIDAAGNCYLVGSFRGIVDFDGTIIESAGEQDIFLIKYNSSGKAIWAKGFGSSQDYETGTGVAIDTVRNAPVIVGNYNGDVHFGQTILYKKGGGDIFVCELDSTGNVLWAKRMASPYPDNGRGIAVDGAGDVFVCGDFQGSIDLGGEIRTTVNPADWGDMFLAKLDESGALIWAVQAGGMGMDWASGVAVAASGESYLTGTFSDSIRLNGVAVQGIGNVDILIAKFTASGALSWAKAIGSTQADFSNSIAVDNVGACSIAGNSSNSSQGYDIFIAKLLSDGTVSCLNTSRGGGTDFGTGISVDKFGNGFMTGFYEGTMSFLDQTLTSAGGRDVFFGRFSVVE